jgi:hypothetical protein
LIASMVLDGRSRYLEGYGSIKRRKQYNKSSAYPDLTLSISTLV